MPQHSNSSRGRWRAAFLSANRASAARNPRLRRRDQRWYEQISLRRPDSSYVIVPGSGRTERPALAVVTTGDVMIIGFGVRIQVLLWLRQVWQAVDPAQRICNRK